MQKKMKKLVYYLSIAKKMVNHCTKMFVAILVIHWASNTPA